MVGTYVIAELRPDQIVQAYPLVQAAVPTLGMVAWRRMASDANRTDEILAVVHPRGYIQGLSIHRHWHHPTVGPLLDVIFLIVTSAADERGIAQTLFARIRSRAMKLKCKQIRFWNQNSGNWEQMHNGERFYRLDHGFMTFCGDEDP
ncbi:MULTISPECIES: hypothetical protein [unclassified Rhizobium]|jgi:hypothetical protein|uniref:hypothetical protein n=1 Tax=unclassified Rhizobium TaxID=2613769 RepID=UPI000645C813|nr:MULTISPECIES: hypothetical protein [unclassified Rhizobium]OJY73488.1 MAG: hypothetical protein BGP09_13690 [Rhizobium sp. 60-20]RKD35478.1 hypothetical protein BJ928_1465 [Rhizobium sp. WW_1]